MADEKISYENFLTMLNDRIAEHMEERDPRDKQAVEAGVCRAWLEILAQKDATLIAEMLNLIKVRYYLIRPNAKPEAEVISKSINREILEMEAEKYPGAVITSKIIINKR